MFRQIITSLQVREKTLSTQQVAAPKSPPRSGRLTVLKVVPRKESLSGGEYGDRQREKHEAKITPHATPRQDHYFTCLE